MARIEARREEQAARDAMAKRSDQAVEVVFQLQDMINTQQSQLQILKEQVEDNRKDAQEVKIAVDSQTQFTTSLSDCLQQQVEEVGKKVKGVLDIITPQVVKTSEDISQVATNVVEQVEEMLESVGQELRTHVEDGTVALTDKLEATMDIVEDWAKELTKEVKAIKASPITHES